MVPARWLPLTFFAFAFKTIEASSTPVFKISALQLIKANITVTEKPLHY